MSDVPRTSIIPLIILALTPALAFGQSPHLDQSLLPGSCSACHVGHGLSNSPMLPGSQLEVCLTCHGTTRSRDAKINSGALSPSATPTLMASLLARPFVHPIDQNASSASEPGATTCSSCHSPHRGTGGISPARQGVPKVSPRNPSEMEYQLCESCHGMAGTGTGDPNDISRLLNPNNRSFHPVEGPAIETSPSVKPELRGARVNCTDCHGNSDPNGPRGPHASDIEFILSAQYRTTDGPESPEAYTLCYSCHDREALLRSSAFPEHGEHIVEIGASCATCHNPHGSRRHRSLIRFGEETGVSGVSASISTGRLDFVSTGPGSGGCFLNCHGEEHGPASYGSMKEILRLRGRPSLFDSPAERSKPKRD